MNKKLNKQYFETKKTHKENYGKGKLSPKGRLISLILLVLFVVGYSIINKSCKKKIEENKLNDSEVIKTEYSNGKIHHIDTLFVQEKLLDTITYTIFLNDLKTENIFASDYIQFLDDNDSIIKVNGSLSKLIAKKDYGGKIISKYYYDVSSEVDEEGYYYVLDDKYLIAYYSQAWDLFRLYKYKGINIDELLLNDKSDFFDYRKRTN